MRIKSTTHGVFGGLAVLEVFGWVLVVGVHSLTPSELLAHVLEQVDIVVSTAIIAVSLTQGLNSGFVSGVHVDPFDGVVVFVARYSAEVAQEVDVLHVVVHPDGSVESHFAVLS